MTSEILILFDIDGTLLRVGDPFHARAMLDAVRQVYGLEPDLDGIPRAGMLDAQILRLLLARHGLDDEHVGARIAAVMETMGQKYETSIAGYRLEDRLLPGAKEAVDAVRESGWTAGVLTGNARSVGILKLQAVGLGSLATIGAYGDSARERDHLVQDAHDVAERRTGIRFASYRTVLVGDTPNDIAAAREAGVRVIAVATGRSDLESLEREQPDEALADLTDTERLTQAIESVVR